MESLGVSPAYAAHFANQLDNVYSGNGDALGPLSDSTAKLARRLRAQGYGMGDVVKAFNDAATQTKANAAEIAQMRTLVDHLVRDMTKAPTTPGPNGTEAMLASPRF